MNITPAPTPSSATPTTSADAREVRPRLGGPQPGRRRLLAGFTGAAVLALAACAADDTPASSTGTSAAEAATATSAPSDGGAAGDAPVEIHDAWAKAAETGMTGVFARIVNTGDATITLVAAESDAASRVELHETAPDGSGGMSMNQKEGGFPIEPGAALELAPGGDHIMLMGLTRPVPPGESITITLRFADGSTVALEAVAKEFAGANESYASDGGGH
ncbi:copper chaperone PCu(A)C [Brachybacterium sp. EF45031]|uniref:copper chaperone PCu(A)C n=1 Tax=Brachybacterium sillae TaxID=2810536 RepID=UPI00217D0710|nr:copper chaperone PCu(A)C [Brachybacterium sillae]MCS6711894.1 copper chaperone PCu(A)C [Brachybacterium sillae]